MNQEWIKMTTEERLKKRLEEKEAEMEFQRQGFLAEIAALKGELNYISNIAKAAGRQNYERLP